MTLRIVARLLTAGGLLACAACASPQDDGPGRDTDVTLAAQVADLAAGFIGRDGPGCAIGVYRSGRIVLARGYGQASGKDTTPVTPRTVFNLGSASKPFTALAALLLDQQGTLSLEDDVRRWVRDLPGRDAPIRVRDLLQHTSGLRDAGTLARLAGRDVTTMAEFEPLMAAQRELNFPSGRQHEYSHSDFPVLALVIERATGVRFADHLEQAVLGPLGMRQSYIDDGRKRPSSDRAFGHAVTQDGVAVVLAPDRIVGGDNLYTSVEDLAHWDRHFEDPALGGAALLERMLGRPVLGDGTTIPYAYGLRLGHHRGLPTISRGGHSQGMRTEIIRFPDQHLTVAALCNGDHLAAGRLAEEVAGLYLGEAMQAPTARPPAPAAVPLPAEALARFAGVYAPVGQPDFALPVEVRDGRLGEVTFDEARDEQFFPMTPAGGTRFFEVGLTGNIGLFTFTEEPGGIVTGLEISWSGGPAERLERVPPSALWRPSAQALAAYAGRWFSEELDAGWVFEPRGGHLMLRRSGHRDLTLRAVGVDTFVRGFGAADGPVLATLRFHRDAAGRLAHLSVSTPPGEDSARHIRFERSPEPPFQAVLESHFGSLGSAPGQFITPRAIAASPTGEIVIADSGNDRLQICSDRGVCTAFGRRGTRPGDFWNPHGVIVDRSGRILTVETETSRVQIFSPKMTLQTTFGTEGSGLGQFLTPGGIAVDARGRVLVADEYNYRVQICSERGVCTAFGSEGTRPGQFNEPRSVAVDSQGRIIVSDRANHRIQICDDEGRCTAFGTQGSGPGQFSSPSEVAIDSRDRIIVADRDNHRIQVCSGHGACRAFGRLGAGLGEFRFPAAVAVDAQDRIIVADRDNARIQIFRVTGGR